MTTMLATSYDFVAAAQKPRVAAIYVSCVGCVQQWVYGVLETLVVTNDSNDSNDALSKC